MVRGDSSLLRSVVAASLFHAAMILCVRACGGVEHVPARRFASLARREDRFEEIEIAPPLPTDPPRSLRAAEISRIRAEPRTRAVNRSRVIVPDNAPEPAHGLPPFDPDSGYDEAGAIPSDPLFDGASLLGIVHGLGASPAAMSTTPRARQVGNDEAARSLEAVLRAEDVTGSGDREARFVASRVRTLWRRAPVPDGTRTRIEVDIDKLGWVTRCAVTSASGGTDATWKEMSASLEAELSTRIDLGPSALRAGVRIILDARVLHVYANGTDGIPIIGECPTMPLVGGETPAPFGNIGGALYGDRANGTCALSDGPQSMKHIEVRTEFSSIYPGSRPPPLQSRLEAAWPVPKPRMPSLQELVVRAFSDP